MMARPRQKDNAKPRDPSAALRAAASRAACPFCRRHGLEFALRCDLRHGCLFTALCKGCFASFDIVVSESEIGEDDLEEKAGPCPACGGARRVATLSCSGWTHACVYRLECPACVRP